MDKKEESCCTIDYQHHKEIFEQRRQAFLKDPEKAVTTHQAKIRLIKDHYKEAQVPGTVAVSGRLRGPLTVEPTDAVCVVPECPDRKGGVNGKSGIRSEGQIRPRRRSFGLQTIHLSARSAKSRERRAGG